MYIGTQVRLFVHLEGFNQVSGSPSWSDLPSFDGRITKFNASSRVEGVCKMSLPVSSRVLNNLRNCP